MAKTVVTPVKQNTLASKFSSLDTKKLTPFTVDEGYDNELGAHTYHTEYKDAAGNVVRKNVSVEANENTDPVYTSTYTAPLKVGNQTFNAQYGEDGNFQVGYGKEFYQNGHHWLPVLDAQGNISYTNNDQTDGFGNFAKMVALSALTAGVGSAFGGASGLGQSLYGLSGTAGQIAGGATLGAGRAAISGGDIFKGALTGGIGGAGNLGIGDTGFTVGQAMTAVNALKAAEKGDWMNAITGAASLSGAGSTQIGDTGYTLGDLAKNAKLAQSILSSKGNLQSVLSAITSVAGPANKDIIQSLTDAGMSGPQAKDFIEGYFAPGGEGYVAPSTDDTTSGTNLVNGYIDETTGHWIDTSTGKEIDTGRSGPLTNDNSGNLNSMKDWSVDQKTGQWTHTDPVTGEKTVYDYKTPVTGTALTGQQIMDRAGAGTPTSGTRTAATQTPASGTANPAASTSGTSSSPTATRIGLDPLDVLKMKNDVAHIKSLEELFGGSIYDHTPASSAQDQTDVVEAATGGQIYSGGGDIHALLQLLRS
jgi:hypothetical protein